MKLIEAIEAIAYSFAGGVTMTTLGYAFYRVGGEFLLLPGMVMNGFVEVLLVSLVTDGDSYPQTPTGMMYILNVAFYALVLFFVSWVVRERNV